MSAPAGAVEDPAAAARVLADLLGGDAATYEARLRSTAESTIVAGVGGVDQKANVDKAIADGRLAGMTIETLPRVAIATADGVTFVAAATGDVVTSIEIDGGAHGLGYVHIDDPKLYVTTDGTPDGEPGGIAIIAVGGDPAKTGPALQRTLPFPVVGSRVAWDEASRMVHVLGPTPDGTGWTIYVIDTAGDPNARVRGCPPAVRALGLGG